MTREEALNYREELIDSIIRYESLCLTEAIADVLKDYHQQALNVVDSLLFRLEKVCYKASHTVWPNVHKILINHGEFTKKKEETCL